MTPRREASSVSLHHITCLTEADLRTLYDDIRNIRAELEQMPITRTVTGYSNLYKNFFVQHIEGPSEVMLNLYVRITSKHACTGIILISEGSLPPESVRGWSISFQLEPVAQKIE
jgi:hypothetical protein